MSYCLVGEFVTNSDHQSSYLPKFFKDMITKKSTWNFCLKKNITMFEK